MSTADITDAWKHGSMALLSAQRHVDALYEISCEAESQNAKLKQQIRALEAKQ